MILRHFYNDALAQASYLVACAATGEAIVIDPLRDVSPYLAMAESLGVRITAVTETHIHADYLSGTRELSAASGAQMYLSDEGDADWKYAFASDPKVTLLKDGDVIKIGNLSLKALHTPGHTPEHLSFLLTDHATSELPHSLFTGDFVFAGDVGRPDLLERAANFKGTMEAGARVLFGSIQKIRSLPDSVLSWPGHGAGSACGKSLGGSPVTTLGYERQTNWAFQVGSEQAFVDEVLAGQPLPPRYFKMMKMLNKQGPKVLGPQGPLAQLETPQGRLVDIRPHAAIRAEGLPSAVAIPLGKGLVNWAGWLLDYEQPVTLVALNQSDADQAVRAMRLIGLDVVAGWMTPDALNLATTGYAAAEVSELTDRDYVLDVREPREWIAGHFHDAHSMPLGLLPDHLDELPRDRRIVVHCAAGGRSLTAASLLREAGFTNVAEIRRGMAAFDPSQLRTEDREPSMTPQ